MSEGGIGWVAMLLDRLDNIVDRSGYGRDFTGSFGMPATSGPPTCCAATSGSAPSTTRRTIDTRDRIGVENIMVETDYPHGDGTWPDTQAVIEKAYGGTSPTPRSPPITHENAARLFRHPLPPAGSPHAAGLRNPT